MLPLIDGISRIAGRGGYRTWSTLLVNKLGYFVAHDCILTLGHILGQADFTHGQMICGKRGA